MDNEQRFAELETRIEKLGTLVNQLLAAKPVSSGKVQPQEPFDPDQFAKHHGSEWLDQKVRQPKSWKVEEYGEIADKYMSQLSPKALIRFAEMQEYGASEEKKKPSPALNPKKTAKKGKDCFYWEDNEFRAKIARSWAAHGGNYSSRPVQQDIADGEYTSDSDVEEIPF